MHTITDENTVFDSSVIIYNTQPGTVTWESVPDGWDLKNRSFTVESITNYTTDATYNAGLYPSGNATLVALCDKVGKVDGKWISLRLTFSNIQTSLGTYNPYGITDYINRTSIGICNNVWDGIWFFGLDAVDIKIELLDQETKEVISLKGAWSTTSSLNSGLTGIPSPYNVVRGESVRYLTDSDYESFTKQTNGLKHHSNGTWEGYDYSGIDWEDCPGGNNYLSSAVAFGIVDNCPTFQMKTGNLCSMRINLGFSPITLAASNPTKTVSIGGETTALQAVEDGTYAIYSCSASDKVWDVTDGSTSNGAKIQSWESNGTQAQQWKITTDEYGISTIVNVKSGKALDVPDGTVANGKQLQIYSCNNTKAQQWRIVPWGAGYKIVSAVDQSYAIDLAAASSSSGAAIQIYEDNGSAAQQWKLVKVE